MKSSTLAKIFLKSTLFISISFVLVVPLRAQTNKDMCGEAPTESFSEAAISLSKYVAIPSETGNENMAAYFFRDLCQEKELYIETITDSIGSVNFAASLYPLSSKKPNIIFLNHIDVVPAHDTLGWIYPPYDGKIADDKVWGRGALDNKGLAVIQLYALDRFKKETVATDLPYNVTVLSVSGEETGGFTGSALVAKVFKERFTPAVVIGEGGAGVDSMDFLPQGKMFFGISVVEKGFIWLELSCKIPSDGHSSMAGNNYAIKKLVDGLYRLANTRQPIQFSEGSKQMFKHLGKSVGGVRGFALKNINWRVFRPLLRRQVRQSPELESILCNNIAISDITVSISSHNQTPQEATAILDCRYLPNNRPEEIVSIVKKIINDPFIDVTIVRQGFPPYETTPEFFFDELKKAIVQTFPDADVAPILFPASNDNAYFRATGCPVYGLFPMIVSSEQVKAIHNINEYIDLEDLDKGIEVFLHFLKSVQDSGLPIMPDVSASTR